MSSSNLVDHPPANNNNRDPNNTQQHQYAPRRSNRVAGADLARADGHTWQERIAVCEGVHAGTGAPRLLVRSYFRNRLTKERVWDEPPSGASNVKFATAEERRRAELQLNELRVTLDMIPPDDEEGQRQQEQQQYEAPSSSKRRHVGRGLLRRLRTLSRRKPSAPQINDSQDVNLQRAIARSMVEQFGGSLQEEAVTMLYDPEHSRMAEGFDEDEDNDDEDLALAKAMSLSESAATKQRPSSLSEDDMILIALEESRRSAVAAEQRY